MGKEGSQTGVERKWRVLGDVTNRYTKKGFPLFPGKFLIANDTIRKREYVERKVEDPGSRKRVLGELGNMSKGKCKIDCIPNVCGTKVDDKKSLPSTKGLDDGCIKNSPSPKARKIRETATLDCNAELVEANVELDVSHCANRMEKFSGSSDHAHFKVGNPLVHGLGEGELRESCTSSLSLPLWLERARDSLLVAGKGYQGCSQNNSGEMSNIIQTNAAAVQKCKLGLGESPILSNSSIEFMNLMENISQNSTCLPNGPIDGNSEQGNSGATGLLGSKIVNIEELENGQTIFKHDTNVKEDLVSGEACSCSFCLKAAYIWTELLYQDSKDRLSEINKSRREARFLAGRSYTQHFIGRSVGDHKRIMGLESDLMQRWRTLFLHTENILTCESARLQSNLLKLKELRESCKRDVEMISMAPSSES